MKVQIICGFLGAGKTTLLRNLLKERKSDTAVLVNEFGELGIDGALVAEGNNFNVVEMPSGCICCSLRENLVDAVNEIMKNYAPEELIIEPSGIASPSSIIMGLKDGEFIGQLELKPVLGVIDLTFFIEMIRNDEITNFFRDQITNSDVILLNKADLVTPEIINECKSAILDVNPAAVIIPTTYCRTEIPDVEGRDNVRHYHYSTDFQAESYLISGSFSRESIETILDRVRLGEFGEVFRAKGIIKTTGGPQSFDYVHGLVNLSPVDTAEQNKFVFIGRSIDRSKLEKVILGGLENGTGGTVL